MLRYIGSVLMPLLVITSMGTINYNANVYESYIDFDSVFYSAPNNIKQLDYNDFNLDSNEFGYDTDNNYYFKLVFITDDFVLCGCYNSSQYLETAFFYTPDSVMSVYFLNIYSDLNSFYSCCSFYGFSDLIDFFNANQIDSSYINCWLDITNLYEIDLFDFNTVININDYYDDAYINNFNIINTYDNFKYVASMGQYTLVDNQLNITDTYNSFLTLLGLDTLTNIYLFSITLSNNTFYITLGGLLSLLFLIMFLLLVIFLTIKIKKKFNIRR